MKANPTKSARTAAEINRDKQARYRARCRLRYEALVQIRDYTTSLAEARRIAVAALNADPSERDTTGPPPGE